MSMILISARCIHCDARITVEVKPEINTVTQIVYCDGCGTRQVVDIHWRATTSSYALTTPGEDHE